MRHYVLRVEVELPEPDDAAARAAAVDTFAEMRLGPLSKSCKGVTVKLQERPPGEPPRSIPLTRTKQ